MSWVVLYSITVAMITEYVSFCSGEVTGRSFTFGEKILFFILCPFIMIAAILLTLLDK